MLEEEELVMVKRISITDNYIHIKTLSIEPVSTAHSVQCLVVQCLVISVNVIGKMIGLPDLYIFS